MPGPDVSPQTFLRALRPGDHCGGVVADDGRQGVSVVLDGFPARPLGMIGSLDRSWRDRRAPIEPGRRITAVVLSVDLDARLSLRATRPDPFRAFARGHRAGDVLDGTVTKVVPFGVFVRVADGVEGLLRDVTGEDVQVGEPIGVVVGEIDVERRRVAFSDRA
ncbi:S1 RNA-binding domain-containing protein [Spirillospora sp. NPDC000708]|uniref:S1 RNA-binding domain-containing protein n=1 Tax=Actinomadura nitritigenes TaxID=134602 RepID=UPI00335B6C9D